MGFTEDEFYRTPMGNNNSAWVADYLNGKFTPVPSKDERFREASREYYDELHDVLAKKQQDYGPFNIALAPGGPINGLLVRMNDKMQRLINLTYHAEGTPNHESIKDTYADLANYCIIAMMVMDNRWEGVPEEYQTK